MAFGVFIHRSDSIYDDSPAERYQFPPQYLRRVEACIGDWIVYYEPRKIDETRGYFAMARVEQVIPDPKALGAVGHPYKGKLKNINLLWGDGHVDMHVAAQVQMQYFGNYFNFY